MLVGYQYTLVQWLSCMLLVQLFLRVLKRQFYWPESKKNFSRICLDLEQINPKIRGVACAIGSTENESTLQRWIISGPEITSIVDVFDCSDHVQEHHDPSLSTQLSFNKNVKKVLQAFGDMEKPLLDDSNELYDFNTKLVAAADVTKNLFVSKHWRGTTQRFYGCLIMAKDKILLRHYSKKIAFFFYQTSKTLRKDEQLKSARNNANLFSRLLFQVIYKTEIFCSFPFMKINLVYPH